MRKPPTINDAKKLVNEFGAALGVIVIAFDGEQYKAVSYGHTRAGCDALRRVTDQIATKISNGEIEP
jgi:hypothetical protein